MPEHLRALVVILGFAIAVFTVVKAPACSSATSRADFERRRNLWFALALSSFLAHNFWLHMLVATVLLFAALPREKNRLALYFALLFAVPAIAVDVPGFGFINYFFSIDHFRLLSLTVLLPTFLYLRKQPESAPFGRFLPDWLIAAYLVLGFLLLYQSTPTTNALRLGAFYPFVDVFLPYYVASRSLRYIAQFRDVLMAYAVAALVLSPVLLFEFANYWLLYHGLEQALGVDWGWNNYLPRGSGALRASGPVGHPIAAGCAMAVAIGFFIFVRRNVRSRTQWNLGLLLLIAGLIAPLSRGPWVGALVMTVLLIATGQAPAARLVKLGLFGLIAVPLLLVSPAGGPVLDHLPFIGTVDASTIVGRQQIVEASWRVFLLNPWFGSSAFLETPEMERLRGGDGLIDIVNTYVLVGLSSGLVGLAIFTGFFLAVGLSVLKAMRRLSDRSDERYVLGQVILCTLAGVLVTIGTVSPVLVIPLIYWSVAGLGVAYAQMQATQHSPAVPGAIASTLDAQADIRERALNGR